MTYSFPCLMVPSFKSIQQEDVYTCKETLGVWDCPAGGNDEHLNIVFGKVDEWMKRMKNGHLPSHITWVAYTLQLWAGV